MTYSRDTAAISELTGQLVGWGIAPLSAGITSVPCIALISSTARALR